MTYAAQVQITAETAVDTAHICYRKARRDVHRIHGLVSHPRTVEAAKIAIWSLYVGAVIAYALGQSARILLQNWVDAQVSSAMVEDAPAHLPAAGEMVDAPAEAMPQEASENPDQWLIDLADEVADQAAAQQHPTVVEFLEAMTTPVLRRECSERGISWKNARGKNRHMTKAQMVEAIAAQYPQGADGPLWHHAA